MTLVFKIALLFFLVVPTLLLTYAIWLFGGWTKGWDYMPNPLYSLLNWVEN